MYLVDEPPETSSFRLEFTKTLVYILTIYFQMFEVLQWSELRFLQYWGSFQNWVETGSTIVNLVLLINYDFFYGQFLDMFAQ